jgi:hypothetical protein
MVKFTFQGKNGPVLGLGLSEENIRRLKDGQPILIEGAPVKLNHDIFIMYGKTEQSIAIALSPYIDPNTVIHKEM